MQSGPGSQALYEILLGGSVALITLSSPPLNPLSHAIRSSVLNHVRNASNDSSIEMIIITGSGSNFSAGADIKEMEDFSARVNVRSEPDLTTLVQHIEYCSKPVVAVIDGVALGGGCELALACHYRVATFRASLGLPEVKLGLIPGAGGTQRLPRLIPMKSAIDMITTGAMIKANAALKIGLVDCVLSPTKEEDIIQRAIQYVSSCKDFTPGRSNDNRRCALMTLRTLGEEARKLCTSALHRCGAPVNGKEPIWSAIVALTAAAEENSCFSTGLELESTLFNRLIWSQQSRARRHLFLAERECSRLNSKMGTTIKPSPTKHVGIIGAGTMGSGIAIAFLLAGIQVVLVDANPDALQRGVGLVKDSIQRVVTRGRLSEQKAKQILEGMLTAQSIGPELSEVDLVVEAVVEKMDLKKKIFAQLDKTCSKNTILCTNTSSLDVDEIASATERPDMCMGMHFFSPAQAMPLVECVKGKETSKDVIAAVLYTVKQLSKVGVVVGNCDGFVGNRMLKNYSNETLFLVEEGASPRQVDTAMRSYGMLKGPLETSDLAGNDISYYIREARGIVDPEKRDPNERYSALGDEIFRAGRMGQKVGKGWYRYEKMHRTPMDDDDVTRIIQLHREANGFCPRSISEEEIVMRCLLPLINEGFFILGEGIAERPGDIDVVWRYGYAWPDYKGGPMFWADELGLSSVLDRLKFYAKQFPNVSHWQAAPLLERLVRSGHNSVLNWHKQHEKSDVFNSSRL